jgi:hypothetical protein
MIIMLISVISSWKRTYAVVVPLLLLLSVIIVQGRISSLCTVVSIEFVGLDVVLCILGVWYFFVWCTIRFLRFIESVRVEKEGEGRGER